MSRRTEFFLYIHTHTLYHTHIQPKTVKLIMVFYMGGGGGGGEMSSQVFDKQQIDNACEKPQTSLHIVRWKQNLFAMNKYNWDIHQLQCNLP